MAAPMPKSVSFSEEKKECLWGANMSRMEMCIIIGIPFSGGVAFYFSGCSTNWTVTRGPSHWRECFLFDPISDLVQDIERVIYLR